MKTDVFDEAEEVSLPSSDDDDGLIEDGDTCSAFEIAQLFQQKYRIKDELAVSLKKDYILQLTSDSSFKCLAAGLSDGSVQIFDINEMRLAHITECIPPVNTNTLSTDICGVRFLDETSNSLLVGSSNGLVRLFDLRTNKEQARFEDSGEFVRTITTFDRNANSRVLCAGTNEIQSNVYLIFFDVRKQKKMGCYFESHNKEVTAVRFHDQNPDLLCTGSVDGLINVYNIIESCEDDALTMTMNTESSVYKLNWHKNVYNENLISCITHINDFKVYLSDEGDSVAEFESSQITEVLRRKTPGNCNLVSSHNSQEGDIILLAGTNRNKGEVMRSLCLKNKSLQPLSDFEGNKQIVRSSIFDAKSNALITAGESGILTLWTLGQTTAAINPSSTLKQKTKLKSNKSTPY